MGRLNGAVSITGLPAHRGMILSVCFYRVESADAPVPYAGDPPPEAATDCHEVAKQVDLDTESQQAAYELPFSVERPPGYYYLQVRAILFRTQGSKVFAQAEQFFYSRRPVEIPQVAEGRLTLPVSWPTQSLEELYHYRTMHPRPKGNT
jgi:hypothetical protein